MKSEKIAGFKSFFSRLKKNDRLAILYHRDPDGLCSALIAAKAIERLRGKKPDLLLHKGYEIFDAKPSFFSGFKKKKIAKLIVVDLGIDQKKGIAKNLGQFSEVLFIDHHKIYADLSSKKITFIKAQFLSDIDASRYPASKMCFDLFSEITDISDLDWIACIGIFGDFGYPNWKDFFAATMERNKTSLHELTRLKDLIESVATINKKCLDSLFSDFFAAKKPGDLSASKHWKGLEALSAEINEWFNSVKERAEFFPEIELVWLEIKSKNNIKSPLINRLSAGLYPNKTVIVVQDNGKKNLFFSARRQDFKVKMNDLLESAVTGISRASAGGHVPAAAGKVPKKDLVRFKKNIIALLKKRE